jgi:AAA domain
VATFTYADLIEWSIHIPEWQRDALRRVLDHAEITNTDIAELAQLAKGPYSAPEARGPGAVPASADQVWPSSAALPDVRLLAVREITRVNALAPGPIQFEATGLTVVYGGNASGKTGIGRILKKACRARDRGGSIRSNVFQPVPAEPASATLDFEVDGVGRSHTWVDGGVSDPDLRTINVFDSGCAAIQVEKANFISYTPAILQVFRDIASVTDRVAETLRAEKATLDAPPSMVSVPRLPPNTAAGRFLNSLQATSRCDDLERLCTLTSVERERAANLARALADDPLRTAEAEVAHLRRLTDLGVLTASALQRVSDEATTMFVDRLEEARTTREAAEAARAAFAGRAVLEGLGTAAWRLLWDAARRYSEVHAYPHRAFPVLGASAVCVFCQQPLSDEASERLHSFENFVMTDVQRTADRAAAELAVDVAALRSLPLPRSARAAAREVGLPNREAEDAHRRFLVIGKIRRRFLLRAAEGMSTRTPPLLPKPPELRAACSALETEIKNLRLASRAEGRLAMERDRDELQAREKLAPHLPTLLAEIARLRAVERLDKALADCKTHSITLKAGQAATAIISDSLRGNFGDNLLAVGFSETPVEVRLGAGERGAHPYEMKLTARSDVPPSEVLSEGERTCVALAGFLAEIETTGNRSAIILDDPVTSLDHRYRERFAERLVQESKSRQVIILTHDIVFLFMLRKYGEQVGIVPTEVSVRRGYNGGHGVAEMGPPWEAMLVRQRLGKLRSELQNARALLLAGDQEAYDQKAEWLYSRLRQSWERAVEEVLLNNAVIRFRDSVETQRLEQIADDVKRSDIQLVDLEMTRCSGYIHDKAGAAAAGMPGPDIIASDIEKLQAWVKDMRKNRGRN